ncbi:type II secretion system protein [Aeoliella sp. SH292]|uniref:type II secretion system protein n=1 Tax=Aeoliella sp. SH292 TaxID=3454464 RepID=UPI003F9D99DC
MIWNLEGGRRKAERRASVGMKVRASNSPFTLPHSPLARGPAANSRSGFTLVELLIVISIIAILSAMLLGVAATSAEQARGSRSKSMVAKINSLVMQQYDTYKDRRAPVKSSLQGKRSIDQAKYRLSALRELMKMEMPDRWSDVLLGQVPSDPKNATFRDPDFLAPNEGSTFKGPTPIIETYRRQYFAMANANVSRDDILANESAECLYLFVMHATSDGEARGLFNESSIGDTDGDGAYEFLDGWGNPISFIRWPAGFDSSKQNNVPALNKLVSAGETNKVVEAIAVDHDPFDMFRVDSYPNPSNTGPRGFRLMPLIYSLGSDEASGLQEAPNYVAIADPYASPSGYLGESISDESVDNITNHNLTGE